MNNKDKAIPEDVQAGLDAYATYYLALAHWKKPSGGQVARTGRAQLFRNTLELLPEPGPISPTSTCFGGGPTQTWAGSTRRKRTSPGDRV